jgi:hypothetical protein
MSWPKPELAAVADLSARGGAGAGAGGEQVVVRSTEFNVGAWGGWMPDHPMVRALFRAVMAAGPAAEANGWREGIGGLSSVQRIGLGTLRVVLPTKSIEEGWSQVRGLSPLALDALILVLLRATAESGDTHLLRATDVLEAKGRRRYGAERADMDAQVCRDLATIGHLRFGWFGPPVVQVRRLGDAASGVLVRFEPALQEAWRRAPKRFVDAQVLRFDHRQNRGADALAKRLALEFSLSAAAAPVARSVRSTLKAVGALEEATGPRGGRLADRFEEAVLRLQENNLFRVSYRGGGSVAGEAQRVKGWVKRWLDTELLIESQADPCFDNDPITPGPWAWGTPARTGLLAPKIRQRPQIQAPRRLEH